MYTSGGVVAFCAPRACHQHVYFHRLQVFAVTEVMFRSPNLFFLIDGYWRARPSPYCAHAQILEWTFYIVSSSTIEVDPSESVNS